MRTFADLVGRVVEFWRDGYYQGRVVRVEAGKRIGLRSVTVHRATYEGCGRFTWHGERVKVLGKRVLAVLWFGKLRPLANWMKGGA